MNKKYLFLIISVIALTSLSMSQSAIDYNESENIGDFSSNWWLSDDFDGGTVKLIYDDNSMRLGLEPEDSGLGVATRNIYEYNAEIIRYDLHDVRSYYDSSYQGRNLIFSINGENISNFDNPNFNDIILNDSVAVRFDNPSIDNSTYNDSGGYAIYDRDMNITYEVKNGKLIPNHIISNRRNNSITINATNLSSSSYHVKTYSVNISKYNEYIGLGYKSPGGYPWSSYTVNNMSIEYGGDLYRQSDDSSSDIELTIPMPKIYDPTGLPFGTPALINIVVMIISLIMFLIPQPVVDSFEFIATSVKDIIGLAIETATIGAKWLMYIREVGIERLKQLLMLGLIFLGFNYARQIKEAVNGQRSIDSVATEIFNDVMNKLATLERITYRALDTVGNIASIFALVFNTMVNIYHTIKSHIPGL